jgi:Ca2+-transporting ATPase
MEWHSIPSKEVLKNLKTSQEGLSEKEVEKRYKQFGKNILKEVKGRGKFSLFIRQFNSLLIYILICAAIVSALLNHFIDAAVIGLIVIINGVIGFVQEYKAEEIIEKLRRSLQYKVRVMRGGVQKEVDSQMLVPGDIIEIDGGDRILADCRILSTEGLQVNEAILTGESFPVGKRESVLRRDTVLGDRKNMLYAGTTVVSGRGQAVVVGTGGATEFGKLAELVQITPEEQMPLERKVNEFSRNISIAILFFVAIAFFIGVYNGIGKLEMFLVSVSLAIGAIPEGLPAIIAITLAVAIKQMHKVNTLVRKLPAAETLGRATVICTDKTGTLTEEDLEVERIYASGKVFNLEKETKADKRFSKLIEIGLLCNNARDEDYNILGDPTEAALISLGNRFGFSKKELLDDNPRIKEFPFNSERKMMSIVRENRNIKTSYVKGAPHFIVERCTRELIGDRVVPLSSARKDELISISQRMESSGLRVLGFAFRQLTVVDEKNAEYHLTFAGFAGMIDPPRPEVKQAIQEAIEAGIKIKIVTGDSALTTRAIANKVGLDGEMIEGAELDLLADDKWDEVVRTRTIFARVTPEQKLRIVEILIRQDETVAVTGDGVNDILALKRADIGVAMGVRGSDVARDSADIVLLDDNFASIVGAVRQGRRVFENLRKSLMFLLSANMGEVVVIVVALMMGYPLIFLPLAILWMNLVTDSLPALALAVEPEDKGIMKRSPRKDGLLKGIWKWAVVGGLLSSVSVFLMFVWAYEIYSLDVARTMAINVAIFFELFFVFSCKSKEPLIRRGILNNMWLVWAVLVSALLQITMIYTSVGHLFGFVDLTILQLGISIGVALNGMILFEIWKVIRYSGFFRR